MLSTHDDEDVWYLDARGVLALSVADPRQSIALRRRISELTRTLQGVRKKKNCYTGLFYLVKAS